MTSAERATEVKPVSDGLKLVLRQFIDTLGRSNITKVATVGHPFDPLAARGHPAGRDRRQGRPAP